MVLVLAVLLLLPVPAERPRQRLLLGGIALATAMIGLTYSGPASPWS
jgi:hypothetical protein